MDALSPFDAVGNHASLSPEVAHAPIFISAQRNIVCQSGPQLVAALGVDDLVIAVTKDAVLVLPRERAQDVLLDPIALEFDVVERQDIFETKTLSELFEIDALRCHGSSGVLGTSLPPSNHRIRKPSTA
jgi:hypothetical protein